ncbi:hypothetical protein [Streptomyces fagopyri]|uniref:hypothetical protein n=1 Tax=Streptomyces fagopyri TaxID=2662397 RepID=UPI00380AB411
MGEVRATVRTLPLSYDCEWASGVHAQVTPWWAVLGHFVVMAAAASLIVFLRPLTRWWRSGIEPEPYWEVEVVEEPWPAGTEQRESCERQHQRSPPP